MPVIELPKTFKEHIHMTDIYLCADNASVNRYCSENGYTLVSYEKEEPRFSNDGSLPYQYWDGTEWKLEYGFRQIVTKIVYS